MSLSAKSQSAKSQKFAYLDNSASTPVDPKVMKAMMPYFSKDFGNASSLHQPGLDARVVVDRAQAQIAKFLGCDKGEVYFTSGATESDNMAILGIWRAIKQKSGNSEKLHIITTAIEHDAVLEPIKQLKREGAEVTILPVNSRGLVEMETLKKAIQLNTVLVAVMYVNNEIGTIQPIAEIGRAIAEINEKRAAAAAKNHAAGVKTVGHKIYFFTDAVQALNYCDCRADKLGVDALSLSGHKIYGPKGIGALYLKKNTPFAPLIFGGHQQDSIRPGTYPVPLIVGLGKAIEILADSRQRERENKKIKTWRDYLIKQIKAKIKDATVNGDLVKRVPANANFVFRGVEGESVLLMLSQKGIAVSTGSACSSGSLEPSHVLTAIGVKPELAHGSLRVTLGRFTTKAEVDRLVKELPPIVDKLRKMSPLK